MPRGDRTGPAGFGPMTGRTARYCAGHGDPGYANPAVGSGAGVFGGHGWRHMYYATADPDYEKQVLQNQVTFLETTLERLKKRLAELEQGARDKSS